MIKDGLGLVAAEKIEGVKCKEVSVESIEGFEADIVPFMNVFMLRGRGAGLAAPQIGINRTFFVMVYGSKIISCYNPSYRKRGDKDFPSNEACLSYGLTRKKTVRRHKMIVANYTDFEGIPRQLKLKGFTAAVFQHETDHLKGKTLFFDPERAK